MTNGITGYEVREDVLDGVPIFDVYQQMDGDAECVDSFYTEDLAVKYAKLCAKENGLGDVEVKVYRENQESRKGKHDGQGRLSETVGRTGVRR